MTDPSAFGVYSRAELAHVSPKELEAALADGRLRRLRRDWFATPNASTEAAFAISLGGRIGCLSGCALHGLWTPPGVGTHVIVPDGQRRPCNRELTIHRARGSIPPAAVYPVVDCVRQALTHHDAESALMVLESAACQGHITPTDALCLINEAPRRRQTTLHMFDPRSQSGTETRVRLFLQRRRVLVTAQVWIPGVGRVDLLVGRSLIIECDSHAHHSDYREDRRRDLVARSLGYQVLRLSYDQIMYSWDATANVIAQVLATGKHLRLPVPL